MTDLPEPVLFDTILYLTDNGAVYCGSHCGFTARYTGRDVSGQPVEPLTPARTAALEAELDRPITCPICAVRNA